VTSVDDLEYFQLDESVSDGELAFLAALRQRVQGRIHPWAGHRLHEPLFVGLDIDAPDVALLTVGVYFDGGRIRGDRVDIQTYELPDQPTSMAIDATGTPDDLAARTFDWFDAILRRPIVRYEWRHAGQVYANRYLFADTREPLSQLYRDDFAPPGQREQLIAAGHVRGQGWIQTDGLGAPDRVTPISGDN
jgi:hypothetical protein